MRSKEVDESLDRIKEEYQINGIGEKYSEYYSDDIKTALSYIETLEQLPNKIRDKIKEYEDAIKYDSPCGGWESEYNYVIEVLKSIIGE